MFSFISSDVIWHPRCLHTKDDMHSLYMTTIYYMTIILWTMVYYFFSITQFPQRNVHVLYIGLLLQIIIYTVDYHLSRSNDENL